MALINNTVYTPKQTVEYFTDTLLTGTSIERFMLMPGVKNKAFIPSLNVGNLFQLGTCSPVESGNFTLANKEITVCPIDIKTGFCNSEWEASFEAEYMKPGSKYAQSPENLNQFIIDLMGNRIKQQAEYMTWQGNTAGSPGTVCDGIIKKLLADAAVIDVGSPLTLSKANIIAEIERVYNLIPTAVRVSGKAVIFLSVAAADFYMQAQYGTFPALNSSNSGDFTLKYLNTELVVSPGMPTNTMVAGDPENFVFATDLKDDMLSVEVSPDPTVGSKKLIYWTSFRWGVDFKSGAEIVLYGTGS